MKKIFGLSLLIAGSIALAQEQATPAPVAEPAAPAVAETAAPTAVEPAVAEEPAPVESAPAPAEEVAPVVATPVDSAAPASPAETAPVETVQKTEVPADTTPAVAPVDTAQVAAVQDAPMAKKWFHFLGFGLTMPVSQYKIHDKKADFIGYGLNFTYMGMSDKGLSVKIAASVGGSSTDNIRFADSDKKWNIGAFSTADLGMGYTFGSAQSFTLSLLAVAGIEFADFKSDKKEYKHSELGKVDRAFEELMFGITVGGDIIARVAVSDNIGIFASVGGRWVVAVATGSSVMYDNNDDFTRTDTYTDVDSGNYSIVPTIGAMWTF